MRALSLFIELRYTNNARAGCERCLMCAALRFRCINSINKIILIEIGYEFEGVGRRGSWPV